MKKKIMIFSLFICLIVSSLTSCQVNWFDKHYDVPWWMIAIPTVVILLTVWLAVGKYIATKKYICPECNKSFYPKWWNAGLSIHVGDKRVFKCPNCKRKGFCHIAKDAED